MGTSKRKRELRKKKWMTHQYKKLASYALCREIPKRRHAIFHYVRHQLCMDQVHGIRYYGNINEHMYVFAMWCVPLEERHIIAPKSFQRRYPDE